jgi:hypothetical protein
MKDCRAQLEILLRLFVIFVSSVGNELQAPRLALSNINDSCVNSVEL